MASLVREIADGKTVKVSDKPPTTQDRWRRAVQLYNRYQLHESGVTYTMQGYTVDGVTVESGVIDAHLYISELLQQYRRKPAQRKGKANGTRTRGRL